MPSEKQKAIQEITLTFLANAVEKGISPAYFYMGRIYLEGIYVEKDTEKAIDLYVEGAAKNNAFCFFELSRIYAGEVEEKDPYLQFLYLKRAAEEGYVPA